MRWLNHLQTSTNAGILLMTVHLMLTAPTPLEAFHATVGMDLLEMELSVKVS